MIGALVAALAITAATLPGRLVAAVDLPRVAFPNSIREVALPPASAPSRRAQLVRSQLLAAEAAADMRFEVVLRMRNFGDLQSRLNQNFPISPAEMAANYFPLADDYARTIAWLEQAGLTVTRTDANRLAVFGHGTVAAVQQTFQVSFARVAVGGIEYTSAISAPTLPASLAPAVLGIHGLQPHLRPHRAVSLRPAATNGSAPYLPAQIARAYGATGLPYTGNAQTIAIFGGAFPSRSDLTQFGQTAGTGDLSAQVQFVPVGTGPATPADTGFLQEATLDAEWAAALAPGAMVRLYGFNQNDPAGFDEAYQQVYADLSSQPNLHQLSISFGYGETEIDRDYVLITAQYTALLASAGVTIFASSGDTGQVIDGIVQVTSPASDPSVTGVGGTSLRFNVAGSAVSSEEAWPSSGGGASSVFARPAWQVGTGLPALSGANQRLVPDVAAVADPNTGAVVMLNGVRTTVGGTSWSAPVWAAFCALINEARGTAGQAPLGLLNPKLYPLIGTAAFRDIISGPVVSNRVGVGYDLCTGVGVPNVAGLIQLLGNAGTAPLIVAQFADRVVTLGQGTAFGVVAQGAAPLAFQWQRQPRGASGWTSLTDTATYAGTATATLLVYGATYAMNGDRFQCLVTNASGGATSTPPGALTVNPYGVTTLAGWPQQAGSADGRGSTARFSSPGGIKTDAAGNLYVSDGDNSTIRKITSVGVVSTVADSPGVTGSTDGPVATARFNGVGGVAVDSAGNLYVADSGNYTIRKITPAGIVSTLAGVAGGSGGTDGTGSAAQFYDPQNLALDSAGNIYVADGKGHTIRKVTPAGAVTTLAGKAGVSGYIDATGSAARFNQPTGIAVDAAGNIYVADYNNYRIRKVTPDGVVTTLAGSGTQGNLPGTATTAQFFSPAGVAVDAAGNVYVADAGSNNIRQIKPDGTVIILAGSSANPAAAENTDGSDAQSRFSLPADVTVDSAGIIYVADAGNNTIRRIVVGTAVPPQITTQPANRTILSGQDTTYTVAATGSDPLTYQWQINAPGGAVNLSDNATYSGTATTTLTVHAATVLLDQAQYLCTATNNAGAQPSAPATLYVDGAPIVTGWASTNLVTSGGSLTLTPLVAVSSQVVGTHYQWSLNSVALTGATGATLSLSNIQTPNTGTYSVVISNPYGTVNTDVANVTFGSARLVNLSVRSTAGSGSQTLIVGFVIGGSGSKQLLLRGMGPALTPLGVSNALADPSMRLLNASGGQIDANDDWGGSPAMTALFNAVGAFVPPANSKDAALSETLPAGLYTFHILSTTAATGVALAELYDADAVEGTAKLVNISARTQVGTGEDILIAGFVITGNASKTLLIRGLGPSLAAYGVTGVLADPQLYLFHNGTIVASNDDWGGTTLLKNAFTTVGAGALVSDTSKDAALLVTLPPGVYSAQVSGVGGTTGVGLVEIFVMP